eukprot:scaffold19173_cov156-Amphora_coffeaeformis.AAC.1
MFASSDLDSSQVIHFDEFKALMKHRGDTDGSAGPSLHDKYRNHKFRSHVLKKFSGPNHEDSPHHVVLSDERLREMFDAMDTAQSGYLDGHEIRVVLRSTGETEDFISQIVATVDKNRDGGVSWEEFVEIMRATEDEEQDAAQSA